MTKNSNICKKLLFGTFLLGSILMIGIDNKPLNAYTGYVEITNLNKYCVAGDKNGSKLQTENDECKFTHRSVLKSNFLGNFDLYSTGIYWDQDGELYNDATRVYYKIFDKDLYGEGDNYTTHFTPALGYKYVNQTGDVTISQQVTVNNWLYEQAYVTAQIKLEAGKNPRCWVKPVPFSNSGLSYVETSDGKTWLKYNQDEDAMYGTGAYPRKVYFKLDGEDLKPNADGTNKAGDSYEERGGSSRDPNGYRYDGHYGDVVYDWNTPNYYISSFPLDGYKSGDKVNQMSHSYFGEEEWCKVRTGYGIDGDLPVCKLTKNPTTWTNGNVTVTKTCSDGSSGCDSTSVKYTITTNQVVTKSCKDKVNNYGKSVSITVNNIDKIAPEGGNVTATDANHYYNTAYQVNVPCTDPQDNTNTYRAEGDRASGCKKSTYTANTDSSGNYSVKIYDNAGNVTTVSDNLDLTDTAKPTVTITLETGQEGYNSNTHFTSNATVKATIKATDSGKAGVKKVCYTLSGATTKSETCVDGSSTTITISNKGNTKITAYAYDNAYDYNGGSPKWNGNKSDNATKTVYIDRTNPTVTFTTTPSDEWTKNPPTASFTASDSQAGLYTVETVWANTTDSAKAFADHADAITKHSVAGNAFNTTAPKDKDISGEVYLHVKVCDNAFSTYNTHQPNCTTSHLGPFKFDIIDPPVPVPPGIDEDDDGNPDIDAPSMDWTHVLKNLIFTAKNSEISTPESGLAKINLYFDNNNPYTNTDINKATFDATPTVSKVCSTNTTSNSPTTCKFSIDFSALKSDPVQSGEGGAVTEGVRFIKVEVYDLAGNKSSKVFGPYKWDTTKSKFTSNVTVSGEDGKFYHE